MAKKYDYKKLTFEEMKAYIETNAAADKEWFKSVAIDEKGVYQHLKAKKAFAGNEIKGKKLGVIGLGAAIDYIQKIGYDNIHSIEDEVISYAVDCLRKLDFLDIYMTKNSNNHSSVISFNIKGVHPHDVASILDTFGVCIRSGNHCAQPLMRYLKIDSTCRASFYIYNTKQDVDKLVLGLKKAYEMFSKYIRK